jgi:NodT family efflux transporter outer membrane factor (OMF) lipoprotein
MKRFWLVIAPLLGACTVGPDYHAPEPKVPPSYRALADAPYATPVAEAADLSAWWTQFNDPELQSLVARALKANLDLKTAASRVRQARTQEIVAGAAELPTVNASGNAAHLHSSSSPLQSLSGGASSGSSSGSPPPSGGTDISLYSVGFDASWELDIFGGGRRGIEAAKAQSEAALWQMRDGEVTLTAEIAADYMALRAAQARKSILQRQLKAQQDVLELVAARARTGFVTELDVNQQKNLAAATAAQIPALDAQALSLEHAIATLLAQEPDALAAELEATAPAPALPAGLPVGMPSDLLRRRPDIRAAERNLAAATAEIGVAVADLYPKFNLLAGVSLASNSLDTLFDSKSLGEFGLGMITWPIFNAGKTEANIAAKQEGREQAYFAYQKAVLGAVKDVEDALVRVITEQRRIASLADADASARESTALALQQYRAGLVTYVNVLTAQNSALSDDDQLSQARAQLSADLVALYKALGGGWGGADAPDPATTQACQIDKDRGCAD